LFYTVDALPVSQPTAAKLLAIFFLKKNNKTNNNMHKMFHFAMFATCTVAITSNDSKLHLPQITKKDN